MFKRIKKNLIIIVIICVTFILISFKINVNTSKKTLTKGNQIINSDSLLVWDRDRKLTWDDFLGKPNPKIKAYSFSTAEASTGHIYGISSTKEDSLIIYIYCIFNKNKSWSITKNEYSLNHEQKHFDLAEVVIRRFRRRVLKLRPRKYMSGLKQAINMLSVEYYKERDYYQGLYDDETNHGIDRSKQEEWNQKIDDMLEELEEYSRPRIEIERKKLN